MLQAVHEPGECQGIKVSEVMADFHHAFMRGSAGLLYAVLLDAASTGKSSGTRHVSWRGVDILNGAALAVEMRNEVAIRVDLSLSA